MNITKDQFKAIEDAYYILAACDGLHLLPDDSKATIVNLRSTLTELKAKKERDNARTAEYIAEKRKTNKDYARTPYVKKGDREK